MHKAEPKSFGLLHPALVYVTIAWGLNFAIIKLTNEGYKDALPHDQIPAALTLLRYIGMYPLLLILAYRESKFKLTKQEFWKCIQCQFVASGVYMILFMEGMLRASAPQASVALAVAPLIATGISIVIGLDTKTKWIIPGMLLAFGGIAIMSQGSHGSEPKDATLGVILIVASALAWGTSVIMAKKVLATVKPMTMLAVGFPGALVPVIAYGAVPLSHTKWETVTPLGHFGMFYLVVLAGVLAFWAYYKGLQDVGPARTSLVQYLIPPTAAISSIWLVHDPMLPLEWLGLVVVLAGVWMASRKDKPLEVVTS